MKRCLLVSSCVALAQAQSSFPWDVIDAAPPAEKDTVPIGGQPVSVPYDSDDVEASIVASITSSSPVATVTHSSVPAAATTLQVVRRDGACATQPAGSGPVPTPDTAASFLAFPDFANAANNAQVPRNYIQTFANLNSANNDYGFLGLINLASYDTQACATACDNTNGCSAINIYFERDPSLSPDDKDCPNPASTTTIKCVFWGGPVNPNNAGDKGKPISQFQVVMAGSNGYVKKNFGSLSGYTSPLNGVAVNAAINAPNDCTGKDTFMGAKTFTSGPFDASLCAAACAAQTKYNVAHPPAAGAPKICQFFNTYMLMKNNITQGQICAMYTDSWDQSYFANNGQWRGQDHYTSTFSLSYSNTTNPGKPPGLDTDPKNCGACGNVCGANTQCIAGMCKSTDPCQKVIKPWSPHHQGKRRQLTAACQAIATFTIQVQGGQYDKYYLKSSDPSASEITAQFVKDPSQASQFQLDRSSQHLAILQPNSNYMVLYSNVNAGQTTAGVWYFDTVDAVNANVIANSWAWVDCQITAGGLLACNDGGLLHTNAYPSGGSNTLFLTNGNQAGYTSIGLAPLCT
ncbi:hypothetical protein PG988_006275 [Apiospora saccharicola]